MKAVRKGRSCYAATLRRRTPKRLPDKLPPVEAVGPVGDPTRTATPPIAYPTNLYQGQRMYAELGTNCDLNGFRGDA